MDCGFEAWFDLAHTPALGRGAVRRLLAALGTPEAVLQAPPSVWQQVAGSRAAQALGGWLDSSSERVARRDLALAWLGGGRGRHWVALGDARYPSALLETTDPPVLMYLEGEAAHLKGERLLAIVGSRHPTRDGSELALAFSRDLAARGWTIVSGLAAGIDTAAHQGALGASGGATVAVVGTGLDQVYPRANEALARRIAEHGLLVSELPPGAPPLASHFPARNRIIAGLSRGVLVVEAALQSGSLISARLAAEAGREVLAIPGSIHAPQSKGCHALIKQGAKLVESVDDIETEFAHAIVAAPVNVAPARDEVSARSNPASIGAGPDGPDAELLGALGHGPIGLDALCNRLGWPVERLSARLLELELTGQVSRLPGGLYQRRHLG
jgi:DNA processing protein